MLYEIAGNYNQFRFLLKGRNLKPRDAIYISSRKTCDKITKDDEIVRIGSYYERMDLEDIEKAIKERLDQ